MIIFSYNPTTRKLSANDAEAGIDDYNGEFVMIWPNAPNPKTWALTTSDGVSYNLVSDSNGIIKSDIRLVDAGI
jgi:hypothetical protein